MLHFARRSLLYQLLSVYLLFVIVVLAGGLGVNAVVGEQLLTEAQASDEALAQEIALETSRQLLGFENSVVTLGKLIVQNGVSTAPQTMAKAFQAFQAARSDASQTSQSDVDHIYWLDPIGTVLVSWPPPPPNGVTLGVAEFSPSTLIEQARRATGPVFQVGIASETGRSSGVIIAEPEFTSSKTLTGIVAASLSLDQLSNPLGTVIQAQQRQGRHLMISIIDAQGVLIATPDHDRILNTVLDELPGADLALRDQTASRTGRGSDGHDWLFSAVPVPNVGWAVIVQRPIDEVQAVLMQFHLWLLATALLFALIGVLFWLMLFVRVIRPLHTLTIQHQTLPVSEQSIPARTTVLAQREDEIGELTRSLIRLERDGLEKLSELRTLLETSNAVVASLEPRDVVGKIIREVRRLVDVQAAAVLLPNEQGTLRVLVSEGHSKYYDRMLSISPEALSSAAVSALRDGKPIQRIIDADQSVSRLSYDEGFRTVLAIPIISMHAGDVVLLVHRTEPHLFNQNEIDLLLTFANYAAMAWEHAVLYERSDERLHEEKQRLEAIMGSMSDGLVLTGSDGTVLYANQGAYIIAGLPTEALEGHLISVLYNALSTTAVTPETCLQSLAQAESGEVTELVVEIRRSGRRHVIHLRLFDVSDESGQFFGRGLLLRDVTREHELDEFKTTLLAAVGHELRTPLAAIKGHASTLLQEDITWSLEDQRHFLQTISSEADRLTQLVRNLLDLSRQEAGLLLLNRMPHKVQDLVARVIERSYHSGISISLRIPDDLPLVNVDQARIEVVLHNLITNALTYGENELCIAAERREEEVIISVSDNGPGIAPDELPYVFERFYRARHGRQQRSGGTGLGLTISKAFVEAHGSAIWVESNSQGTTFSFSLPIAPQQSTPQKNGGMYDEKEAHSAS